MHAQPKPRPQRPPLLPDPADQLSHAWHALTQALARSLPVLLATLVLGERALSAAWPGATLTTEPATAYDGDSSAALAATELRPAAQPWRLIASDSGPDPLRLVLGQLAQLEPDEHAVVQLLARPAT